MKALGLFLLVSLVAISAVADPIDPQVVITNGTGTTFLSQPIFNFSLSDSSVCTLQPDGSHDCPFMNVSGTPWVELDLFINPPQAPLSCEVLAYFGSCIGDANGGFEIRFLNGAIPTGSCENDDEGEGDDNHGHGNDNRPNHPPNNHPPDDGECTGQEFVLVFSPEFNPNTGISAAATPAPEPTSMVLLGTGILGIISRRKKS